MSDLHIGNGRPVSAPARRLALQVLTNAALDEMLENGDADWSTKIEALAEGLEQRAEGGVAPAVAQDLREAAQIVRRIGLSPGKRPTSATSSGRRPVTQPAFIDMRLAPRMALNLQASLLMAPRRLDTHAFRRLALRVTGSFKDPT